MNTKIPPPKLNRNSIASAVEALLVTGARQATVYQHPYLSVKATLRFKLDKRNTRTDIVLTIGQPNYEGRLYVKKLLADKEPFPVKKVQLKFWPQKKQRGRK